jgi:hypothetical protein
MKAGQYDRVRLLVDVASEYRDQVLARGTEGTVVETFQQPREGYAVDFAIPDSRLAGGHRYENVMLAPDQFEVVARHAGG